MVEEGSALVPAFRRASDLAVYNPQGRFLTHPMVKILALLVVGYLLSVMAASIVQLPFTVIQQIMIFREVASGSDPNAPL